MHEPLQRRVRLGIASFLGLALAAAPIVAIPAQAAPDGTGVVINELYSNGSGTGRFTNRYVELYNPTSQAIDLSSMSIQYRSATGTASPSGVTPLSGSIPANGYFLVRGGTTNAGGTALPTPDVLGSIGFSGSTGTVILANTTTALTAMQLPVGNATANAAVIDLIGYGASNTFETAVAPAGSTTTSTSRTGFVDSDSNLADFSVTEPTPTNSKGETVVAPEEPEPEVPPTPGTVVPIAAIQGTSDTSPLVGQTVTTRGVVTASYPTGGLNGYYIQTPGTGTDVNPTTHTASDGLFVYSTATVASVAVGSYVEVTGPVSEFNGMTQITVTAGAVSTRTETVSAPVPAAVAIPKTATVRESFEGMLIAPQGDYTVTDNYDSNYYGSVILTDGTEPLDTPTAVVEPGADAIAKAADNLARQIVLDDGASTNFNGADNRAKPLPYLSLTDPVRVGAAVTFTKPVILDYRYSAWNFQPTQELTPANAASVQPATFENTRTAAPAEVGGDVTIASFNVLNYFSTVGTALSGCSYYTDRAGNPITVSEGCNARGAATQESLLRQQAKIVSAINALDADVVSLMEIENSASVNGQPRDTALASLTDSLNAAAGVGTWSFVASPSAIPANEDVIRTAFIYKSASVTPVGASVILDDAVFTGSARQPLAQAFTANGAADSTFVAIANHFKSKGSGSGDNADTGDGQGASNLARVNQATALVAFAEAMKTAAGTERVLLAGDFNAYLKEDPIDVLIAAGYADLGSTTGKESYSFDAGVGSLDHIFASTAAQANVSGVDIWNINSVEAIALEYSRYNYNALNLYAPDAYRSSDHDPVIVGLDFAALAPGTPTAPGPVTVPVLAATGIDIGPVVASGLLLLLLGGTLLLSRRRREALSARR
jgi:5'-nucleotidase